MLVSKLESLVCILSFVLIYRTWCGNVRAKFFITNRPYSRWLFLTYPKLLRCQIQAGQSELVSLIHFLPRDSHIPMRYLCTNNNWTFDREFDHMNQQYCMSSLCKRCLRVYM